MKRLLALQLFLPLLTFGALDSFRNFSYATLDGGIDDSTVTVTVVSTNALPAVPYNAAIWNSTDYSPDTDPDVEIVRVTAYPSSTTLTVTRAQEGTSAAAHNTGGKTYMLLATITAKTFNVDLPATFQATNTVLTTWSGITPGANVGTFLATPSSANFASAITDETGSGGVVLSNSPSIYNLTVTGSLSAAGTGVNTADSWQITNNITAILTEANPTNVVDLSKASQTNVLDGAVTFIHATNGATGIEKTHVRWLRAGGSDRALTVPTTWTTNLYSPVPANITNGWTTKMYVTSIGDTGSSANQTNVFVSFEFYKNQ